MAFPYDLEQISAPTLGLVVLQSDETLEQDFRQMFGGDVRLHVTRVPSAPDVTPETLAQMANHLTGAAQLFPAGARFAAVGYGCTSGTAQIGAERISQLVQAGVDVPFVTNPLTALVAAAHALGIKRLAFLSPYMASVSDRLRAEVAAEGIETPVFGSFNEPLEENVVRISREAVITAATALAQEGDVDGVFLSCTNLQTLSVIEAIEQATDLPVLSSNQVMAWHMAAHSDAAVQVPGQLGALSAKERHSMI